MTTVHGGLDTAELRSLGLRAEQVLDFSSNVNPLGPSRRIRRAVAGAALSAYPDRHSLVLREALSRRLGVDKEWLLVGNGSTELIHLLARAILQPGDKCLIFEPTFGEYRAASSIAGGKAVSIRADAAEGFQWPIGAAARMIEQIRPRLVFLCNPNNPTGIYLSQRLVQTVQEAAGNHGLLLLDDAYASLADGLWDTVPLLRNGNLAILRSVTKDHALAGIRLGYLISHPRIVSAMGGLQPPWSVNTVAQAAGLASVEDDVHLENAKTAIAESKEYLISELGTLGIPVIGSAANFLLAEVGDAPFVRTALLRGGIAVRDCTSFGLPEYIRIGIRRLDECTLLIKALRKTLINGR